MTNLFYNFYKSNNDNRNKELSECFNGILSNPHIDAVYTIGEYTINHPKVKNISYTGIPKFQDVFKYISLLSNYSDVNVVINSDCYIDHDDSILFNKLRFGEAWCLSRWDVHEDQAVHYQEVSSQDCWAFRGKPKVMDLDFKFGQPGCDNRLAYEFHTAGYRLKDPSFSLKVYHIHESQDRSSFERAMGGYVFLNASDLQCS